MDARAAAIVGVVAVAPLAIILIVAMLRGYDVVIKFIKPNKRD